MVEVVLGPAHSKKSEVGLERFAQSQAMWIVPHRSLARTLRLRVAKKLGAVSELKILTLDDFARSIYQTSNPPKELASDYLRLALLTELKEKTEDPLLTIFKQKTEVARLLAQAIDDLKENLLWPQKGPQHLAKEYEALFDSHQVIDRKSMVAAAVRYLNENKTFCSEQGVQITLLYGFDSFSPLQWRLVQAIGKQTDLWFSLTADKEKPQLFQESLKTLNLIRQDFSDLKEEWIPQEKVLPKPQLFSFSNHDSELEWIAREVVRLHVEENIPFHEIALISGAGGSMGEWVQQVFQRYGVRVQSLAPEPLSHQPVVRHYLDPSNKEEKEREPDFEKIVSLPPEIAGRHLAAWTQWQTNVEQAETYSKLKTDPMEVWQQLDFRPPPLKVSAVHFYGVESPPLENYRVVFVSQCVEGALPRQNGVNLFMSEPLLDETAHLNKEKLHFYNLVTRAKEKLYLSLAQKNAQGQEALPSLFIKEWELFFPGQVLPEAKKMGWVTPYLDRSSQNLVSTEMKSFFLRQKKAHLQDQTILSKVKERLQTGASITQLEAFGKCHFMHFSSHLLRLQDEKENMWQMVRGQIAHDVLADLGQQILEADSAMLLQEKEKLLAKAFKKLEFPLSEAELSLEKNRLNHLLEIFLLKERERLHKRGDLPAYFEKGFGYEEVPFYRLSVSPEFDLLLRGRIDRVDLTEDGEEATVIDYKSGSLPAPKGMNDGINLQIACYLDVCEQVLKLKPKEGFYLSLKENRLNGVKAKEVESRLEQMRLHLKQHASKMSEGSILAEADTAICATCSYKEICRTQEEVF